MNQPSLAALVETAHQAMRQGRPDEAARLWGKVLSAAPDHPDALFHLGQYALFRKDYMRARQMLGRAAQISPRQPAIPLNLSFVCRATGDVAGEAAALTQALTIDPYFYPALLARAAWFERQGQNRQAAQVYRDAFLIVPPEEQLPAALRSQLRHGREIVSDNDSALAAELDRALAPGLARHAEADLTRFKECRDIALAKTKAYTQQPHMLHFPGLAAVPFADRTAFPWLTRLEAASDTIRAEFLAVYAGDSSGIRPYLSHPDGAPLNQWAGLNRSPDWSAYFLWEGGNRVDAHCQQCPKTAAIVESLPLCHQAGFGPTVNFSILKPHTRLPPHTGDVNTRLIVHLPLVIPSGCWFRVGNVTRPWVYGEAWVFDDTIEHEAVNDSDEMRAILMLDVWTPALTEAERDLVTALLAAKRAYYG